MYYLMYEFRPLIDHVKDHIVYYGPGAIVAVLLIYFTRPYSVSLILYSIEITIYLFAMHTVVYILVRLAAWFRYETEPKRFFEGREIVPTNWTTPWLRFWEYEIYDPRWIIWIEVALSIIIIGLVRYYRPMKVQKKLKASVAAPPKKKKKKAEEKEEDGWGVSTTRRFKLPDDLAEDIMKKKK